MAARSRGKIIVKIYCPCCGKDEDVEVYGSLVPAPRGCGNPIICPECGGEWVVSFYPKEWKIQ